MNRDEAREAAFEKWEEAGCPSCASEATSPCGICFDAGYQSREDVASALRELVDAVKLRAAVFNDPLPSESEVIVAQARLTQALSNAERLLNGGGE